MNGNRNFCYHPITTAEVQSDASRTDKKYTGNDNQDYCPQDGTGGSYIFPFYSFVYLPAEEKAGGVSQH